MKQNSIPVGEVSRYIRSLLSQDYFLKHLAVSGEVSNLTYHRSGHLYFTLKDKDVSEEKINQLFQTSFKIERSIAKTKKIISTKQIQPSTVVFLVTKEGEKLPFYCAKNTNEYLALEIPQFFFEKQNKPTTLDKINFTFKPQNSSNYCFSTRVIRYHKAEDEKFYMILAHTD